MIVIIWYKDVEGIKFDHAFYFYEIYHKECRKKLSKKREADLKRNYDSKKWERIDSIKQKIGVEK